MTALRWKKSTRSNGGGNCVEVATPSQIVMVRDSKDRQGSPLSFTADQWTGFVRGIKAGRFDA
ncbi:DUF397 domain-containing protein [Micromonospora sp. NPDC047793]|uniref:DUF397 domain-containing protein n=1 Tax=unclassified Micromonospora TaxID=2617518 RepID=UPI0010347AD5|nr:DUF397 domain-containing protein [Verrucosispora sp. SN26_14.1]TBL40237.1 DUF397 domain-containing protein [Verrucosispora sp. SN26_14.1]